ncbi:uncharacterized protein [Venturia canescens]|uniref:uncharacterized protein isoform X2 n=1 Tax=Venturia canescens TaxID=32260 RepID=UPI001C9BE375|nr:uncharacterized protein LOC122412042 isoform X2 [Venturia canescens]
MSKNIYETLCCNYLEKISLQMNENQLKMIVPPTVGFIVAGVASGIFYLLVESLRKGKSSKSVLYDDSRCACCLKPFLVGRGVECNDCGARSCRKACCRWDSLEDSWFCLFCYHNKAWARRREKWFRSFGGLSSTTENSKNFSTAKSQVYDEGAEHVAIHAELDLAAGGRREGDSMETVRECVEKIVESLVGNVDDTPIDRLYDHPDCKPATDTPPMAHTALRELVERAVDEARKLPCLGATVSTTVHEDSTFSEQNYEDLLATAILNKVIEKFQNECVDGNSNVLHKRTRSKYTNHDNEIGLDEGLEEASSSSEPLSHDDCSSEGSGSRARYTRMRKEPMSLTIEEQIEEVTTYGSDEDLRSSKTNILDFKNSRRVPFPEFGMDIVDPAQDSSDESQDEANDLGHVNVITPIESWEENWLFQKRKIQTHSEPVSMLVPNPSADYRALIGDKDAEETSDLSEFSAQSEDEIEDDELLIEAINGSVPESSKLQDVDEPKFEKVPNGNEKIDYSADIGNKDESYVDKLFENLYRQNIDKEHNTNANILGPADKQENRDSGLSENSFDPARDSEKNAQMPKTPVSSPTRNSPLKNSPEVSHDVDLSKLHDPLVIVDQKIDEDSSHEANSTVERHDEQSRDNIVDNALSSCDANENFKQPRMSGCLEAAERVEEIEEKLDEENHQLEQRVVETSKGGTTSNGSYKKREDCETITNGSSGEEKKSQKQTTAKTKVVSRPEKEILKNGSDNEIGMATPPRPGTIAEREHKKWENAAPIENNPYSEENIQKRLLERQYARRSSSDLSGNSTKLATSPSTPLQIVLGAGRPDFKRFGRDYYINDAKSPNGRSIETGFYTATSRPNSSMSQNSLSTGSDYEHQERSRSVETESTCSTSSESRRKLMEERRQSMSDISSNSYDEIIESERKNAKNVINAKLNNRGNFEEITKPIKRIDLRAYGFENEFHSKNRENDFFRNKSNRVINKLDLRSFGYDSGLRRTQSNNNIDSRVKINLALRSSTRKSNLIEHSPEKLARNSRHETLVKSTENLNDQSDGNFPNFQKLTSAKSVPNIDQISSGFDDHNREYNSFTKSANIVHKNTGENENHEDSKFDDEISEINGGRNARSEIKPYLPSVKRLAQAFNKTEQVTSVRKIQKIAKNSTKDRPTTPEIHIVDTPRQMHSLTARSISREFREGLRQISSKQTSPTKTALEGSHILPKSYKKSPNQNEEIEETNSLIGREKLKSNIHFWEEMNKKS